MKAFATSEGDGGGSFCMRQKQVEHTAGEQCQD